VSAQPVPVRGPALHSPVVEAQELLSRVVAGDERAWNEVVDRYAGLVWSVARSYRLSSAATQDVVQTVWLRLAEHCGRIRQPERLASWLATTTRNEALRVIRGNVRQSPQAIADDLAEPTAPSIEERVGDDATLRAVLQAFGKLSPEDQQLMRLLCAVPPIDYQTIAEMLGRPIGSIGPTRARCLERLKRLLPPGFDPKEGF
jgi:RNA polymerase sigma factor (sigma-70 family)